MPSVPRRHRKCYQTAPQSQSVFALLPFRETFRSMGTRAPWDGPSPRPGEARPVQATQRGDGSAIVDLGFYEFGASATGDFNCDGAVNAFDIDPFIALLTGP
jgi:hypothetical protein